MIKAIIFDMYETLITQYHCETYFSPDIASDMGISYDIFTDYWNGTDTDRSIGNITFEETILQFMKKYECYNKAIYDKIIARRYQHKMESYDLLHPHIIPMLHKLKQDNIKIGLISNCFSEEVVCMKNSNLYSYIDVPVLSYKEGTMKPDYRIYEICLNRLGYRADECIYIGDGGSNELYAAKELGIKAFQAGWYLKERMENYKLSEFVCLEDPMDIINYIL